MLRGYLLPELARRKCCLLEAGEELVSQDTTCEACKEIALGNLGIYRPVRCRDDGCVGLVIVGLERLLVPVDPSGVVDGVAQAYILGLVE